MRAHLNLHLSSLSPPFSTHQYEDAEDKRLSQGGSGGASGTQSPARWQFWCLHKHRDCTIHGRRQGQQIRAQKLEAYLDNDLEAADGSFGRALAGAALFCIFAGLFGVFQYYGGVDGLAAITAPQRAIRGI